MKAAYRPRIPSGVAVIKLLRRLWDWFLTPIAPVIGHRWCPQCDRWCNQRKNKVETRRMNTAYNDDDMNKMFSCRECWEYSEDCWAAQWAEYNASRL